MAFFAPVHFIFWHLFTLKKLFLIYNFIRYISNDYGNSVLLKYRQHENY